MRRVNDPWRPFPSFLLALLALASGCSDGAFATFNSAPGASILAPEQGAVLLEGEPVALRGFVDDGRTRAMDLRVSWSSSLDGQLFEGAPADDGTTALTVSSLSFGEHDLTLRVVDPQGEEDSDRVSMRVIGNAPPSAQILEPQADGVYHSDVPVTLTGLVADAEDDADALAATWTLDGVVVVDAAPPDDAGGSSFIAPLAEGLHTAELRVLDLGGKEATATVSFSVRGPNNLPDCSLDLPAADTTFAQGELITFVGTATDPDVPSSALSVEWSSSAQGVLGVATPSDSGAVTFEGTLLGGTPTVTMVVVDEVGATCADSVSLRVVAPPTITILQPLAGSTVAEGSLVLLQAMVADLEDAPQALSMFWTSSVDGPIGPDVADVNGFVAGAMTTLSAATHTLTVTATDTDGLVGTATVTFTVSAPPSSPVVALGPAGATTLDDLVATVVTPSVDPEGDPITYALAWSKDGVPQPTLVGLTTVPAGSTARGETWSVAVVASDGWSSAPPGTADLTIANAPPSVTAPALNPATLYTTTTTYCAGQVGSDPDGDLVTFTYVWQVNGLPVPLYGTVLGGNWFARGDSVRCLVTPSDGTVTGPQQASAAVTVLNSSPTAPVVSIEPAAPSPGAAMTCTLVTPATDLDGEALTHLYAWTLNGVSTGNVTSAVGAGQTADQDLWTCFVSATDGTATGPSGSASVVVCDSTTWYEDFDGDGWGNFDVSLTACAPPPGWVEEYGDCDDADLTVFPTAGDVTGDAVDTDCDGMECEADGLNGSYYAVCLDNGGWFDAESACLSAGYDGLGTIRTAAEETLIVDLLVASGGAGNNTPWIGLTDQFTPGTYAWTDAGPVSYTNWRPGQPDNGGGGNNCAVVTTSGSAPGGWNDVTCTQGTPGWTAFVCGRR